MAQCLQNSSVHVLQADQVIFILMTKIKIRTIHLVDFFPPDVFNGTVFFLNKTKILVNPHFGSDFGFVQKIFHFIFLEGLCDL